MCKQEGEGLLSQHLSCAEPCVHARVLERESAREGIMGGKRSGILSNPLGDVPPSIAHRSPNNTSCLLYNHMILVFVTKAGSRGRRRQYAHARCTARKGVGGIVSGREAVGPCPGGDYITSLLPSTSILGNLVEPRLCQSFPFPSLAPLCRQLHIIMGIQAARVYLRPPRAHMLLPITVMLLTSVQYLHTWRLQVEP